MNALRQEAIWIRSALESDIESLCLLDQIAEQSPERREFIQSSVAENACYVAMKDKEAVYSVLKYTFYHQGWLDMVYVAVDYRRHGVGSALLKEVERLCKTTKLFTSTNLSNLPMQALLSQHGYLLSGVIHNLDEGDPEIVYFKRLR